MVSYYLVLPPFFILKYTQKESRVQYHILQAGALPSRDRRRLLRHTPIVGGTVAGETRVVRVHVCSVRPGVLERCLFVHVAVPGEEEAEEEVEEEAEKKAENRRGEKCFFLNTCQGLELETRVHT